MDLHTPHDYHPKIQSIPYRKLEFWDPVDFKIKKIIKRNIALHEKARYAKDSIFAQKLINTKLTSRKWTKRVHLSFVQLRQKTTGLKYFLKRNRNLTHLNLAFQENFNAENLVSLGKTLSSSSNLVSLIIDLKYSSDLQTFLHRFVFVLRKLSQLKQNIIRIGEHHQLAFCLDLIKYDDFPHIPSISILKQQQKLLIRNWIFRQTNLTTLLLDMRMQPELNTQDIKKIASFTSQDKNLQVCQISFPKETVFLSTKKLQPLLDSFLHLPNLQVLKMSLKISNQHPTFLSHQAFQLPSLRKIYLKIEYVQPTLKILKNKLQALGTIQKLYSLELDLSKSNLITDEALEDLVKTMSQLKNLRKLTLRLQECKKITENFILSLLKTLPIGLTKLELDFAGCCSTPISSNPNQLHQISDDENIISSNIEKLSLSFANCQQITRVTFSLVRKLLLQAKNLQKLHLNLRGIHKSFITPLPLFHQSRKHLKSIKYLQLIFEDPPSPAFRDDHLNSQDIFMLGNFISQRQQLRKANLDMLKCKNIPQQFFANFLNEISCCLTLRNLTLSINSTLDRDFLLSTENFEARPTGNYKVKIVKYSHSYETTDHHHDTFL